MPIPVIKELEIVHIDERHTQHAAGPAQSRHLAGKRSVEMPSVVDACQVIPGVQFRQAAVRYLQLTLKVFAFCNV